MNVSYSISNGAMCIFIDGEDYSVSKDNPNYNQVWDALKNQDYDLIPDLIDLGKAVSVWGKSVIRVFKNKLYYNQELVNDDSLVTRVLAMMSQGEDYTPMAKFIDNLMKNPDKNVIPQVYCFLKANMLPLTKDGHFLAYKIVDVNFKDCYTHTLDNSIGIEVKEDRELVDADPNITCSKGLHVCSFEYVRDGCYSLNGNRLIICKVSPEHVVAVPTDYNNSKMRVCEYLSYSDITGTLNPETIFDDKIVWESNPNEAASEVDEEDTTESAESGQETVVKQTLRTGQVVARDASGRFTSGSKGVAKVKTPVRDANGRFAKNT